MRGGPEALVQIVPDESGEQLPERTVTELRPETDGKPYLKDGSITESAHTTQTSNLAPRQPSGSDNQTRVVTQEQSPEAIEWPAQLEQIRVDFPGIMRRLSSEGQVTRGYAVGQGIVRLAERKATISEFESELNNYLIPQLRVQGIELSYLTGQDKTGVHWPIDRGNYYKLKFEKRNNN